MTEPIILPREGSEIMLLVERDGIPLTQRARAGRVDGASLLLQRMDPLARFSLRAQDSVTVLFESLGTLYLWPMRIEELLPTSTYLVADRPPRAGQRREFVRARVHAWLGLGILGGAPPIARPTAMDVSASGLSAAVPDAWEESSQVAVSILESAESKPILARAQVVRCVAAKTGYQVALLFHELSSNDEERLAQLVFRAREQALVDRLGRRRGF